MGYICLRPGSQPRHRELYLTYEPLPDGKLYDPRENWVQDQQRTGLYQAAFAILTDAMFPWPPSTAGLPYHWNPTTRELSMPPGAIPGHEIKPIKLPRP